MVSVWLHINSILFTLNHSALQIQIEATCIQVLYLKILTSSYHYPKTGLCCFLGMD